MWGGDGDIRGGGHPGCTSGSAALSELTHMHVRLYRVVISAWWENSPHNILFQTVWHGTMTCSCTYSDEELHGPSSICSDE